MRTAEDFARKAYQLLVEMEAFGQTDDEEFKHLRTGHEMLLALFEEAISTRGNRYGETWHAFECVPCRIVFDVRADELKVAGCPICARLCEVDSTWEADKNGYGSRGDQELRAYERSSQ